MDEYIKNNKIESFKIPERKQADVDNKHHEVEGKKAPLKTEEAISFSDGIFFEIEYDCGPLSGDNKIELKSQKIIKPENDEIRDLFTQMRDIARTHRLKYDYNRFFDKRFQKDNSIVFYKQGIFMKDFTDDYKGNTPFSQYFPYYQMMGYEQLRTYFSWRTKVRSGKVTDTSLSYAFLYIYELLSNIGVESPQEGLEKLMLFWKSFSVYNNTIDKYILQWLKDYHIYYELPQSFKEFAEKNNLTGNYPKIVDTDDNFDLFCAISKYDIRKSTFFTDETIGIITNCFLFVMSRIRQDFEAVGIHFHDALFHPTRQMVSWKPFKNALFHQWSKQSDRRIVLSKNEIYVCSKNEWTTGTVITTEKGRQFIGYVMKQMESTLRQLTKFKYKITANLDMINQETLRKLTKSGIFIEKIVPVAVMDFYKEMTKTVVTVNPDSLARIRKEALVTQEALIVEEQISNPNLSFTQAPKPTYEQNIFEDSIDMEADTLSDSKISDNVWEGLKEALNENELQALTIILQGGDIKASVHEWNVMPEVLIDGINEKAMDYIGDNLMDEDFVLYDDYIEQVEELVK